MSFGLKNDPATFHCVIVIVLFSDKSQFALLHTKVIVVFSKIPQECIAFTKLVLTLLRQATVNVKLKKCASFASRMEYLCRVIKLGRHEVRNHSADAIREEMVPRTFTELCLFLGLYNVLKRFVPNFGRNASSLYKRLERNPKNNLDLLFVKRKRTRYLK